MNGVDTFSSFFHYKHLITSTQHQISTPALFGSMYPSKINVHFWFYQYGVELIRVQQPSSTSPHLRQWIFISTIQHSTKFRHQSYCIPSANFSLVTHSVIDAITAASSCADQYTVHHGSSDGTWHPLH